MIDEDEESKVRAAALQALSDLHDPELMNSLVPLFMMTTRKFVKLQEVFLQQLIRLQPSRRPSMCFRVNRLRKSNKSFRCFAV